jgi:hypothetical protein
MVNDYDLEWRNFYKHPEWIRFRELVFEAVFGGDLPKCEFCNRRDLPLQVHHPHGHVAGLYPWEYPPNSMQVLCIVCHTRYHGKEYMLVTCSLETIAEWSDEQCKNIPTRRALCDRCGHETTSSIGNDSSRSINRCLTLMHVQCPKDEDNFYVTADMLNR